MNGIYSFSKNTFFFLRPKKETELLLFEKLKCWACCETGVVTSHALAIFQGRLENSINGGALSLPRPTLTCEVVNVSMTAYPASLLHTRYVRSTSYYNQAILTFVQPSPLNPLRSRQHSGIPIPFFFSSKKHSKFCRTRAFMSGSCLIFSLFFSHENSKTKSSPLEPPVSNAVTILLTFLLFFCRN